MMATNTTTNDKDVGLAIAYATNPNDDDIILRYNGSEEEKISLQESPLLGKLNVF